MAISRSVRITAAEVVVILWVHRYKIFILFSLISNIFINNGDISNKEHMSRALCLSIMLIPC